MKQENNNEKIEKLINKIGDTIEVNNNSKAYLYNLSFHLNRSWEIFVEFTNQHPLLSYSIKRIFYAIITVLVTIVIIYCMLSFIIDDGILTSDIDFAMLGISIDSEQYKIIVENRKKTLGIDKPLIEQILIYIRNIIPFIPKKVLINVDIDASQNLVGDEVTKWFYLGLTLSQSLGVNPRSQVTSVFASAIPKSLFVGGIATILAYAIGIPLGILAAKNKEKAADNTVTFSALFLIAIPPLVLVKIFYELSIQKLNVMPMWEDSDFYTKLFPIIAVMLLITPAIVVETRRYVIDEMTSDYTKFAYSKGLSESYVFFTHVFRNAFIRMVRNIPTVFVFTIFGSSILTEQMWTIMGMSFYMVKAVNARDLFTVLGYVTLSASAGVFTTLIGDLLMATLDPRVSLK